MVTKHGKVNSHRRSSCPVMSVSIRVRIVNGTMPSSMQTNKNSRLHVRPVEFAPNTTCRRFARPRSASAPMPAVSEHLCGFRQVAPALGAAARRARSGGLMASSTCGRCVDERPRVGGSGLHAFLQRRVAGEVLDPVIGIAERGVPDSSAVSSIASSSSSAMSMNASVSLAPPNATRNWSIAVRCFCSGSPAMSVHWPGRGAAPAARRRPIGGRPLDDNAGSSDSSNLCA